jgi:hypothetical protein
MAIPMLRPRTSLCSLCRGHVFVRSARKRSDMGRDPSARTQFFLYGLVFCFPVLFSGLFLFVFLSGFFWFSSIFRLLGFFELFSKFQFFLKNFINVQT